MEPYVASIIFFCINMTTGIVLRALSSIFLPPNIRGYALDFVSTMEACAYFFENNFVLAVSTVSMNIILRTFIRHPDW